MSSRILCDGGMFHLVLGSAMRERNGQVEGTPRVWHGGFLHELDLKDRDGKPGRGVRKSGQRGGRTSAKAWGGGEACTSGMGGRAVLLGTKY